MLQFLAGAGGKPQLGFQIGRQAAMVLFYRFKRGLQERRLHGMQHMRNGLRQQAGQRAIFQTRIGRQVVLPDDFRRDVQGMQQQGGREPGAVLARCAVKDQGGIGIRQQVLKNSA